MKLGEAWQSSKVASEASPNVFQKRRLGHESSKFYRKYVNSDDYQFMLHNYRLLTCLAVDRLVGDPDSDWNYENIVETLHSADLEKKKEFREDLLQSCLDNIPEPSSLVISTNLEILKLTMDEFIANPLTEPMKWYQRLLKYQLPDDMDELDYDVAALHMAENIVDILDNLEGVNAYRLSKGGHVHMKTPGIIKKLIASQTGGVGVGIHFELEGSHNLSLFKDPDGTYVI